MIDLFEEARAVELDERLATLRARPPHGRRAARRRDARRPCGAGLAGRRPHRAGRAADLVDGRPRQRAPGGHRPATALESVVFAASAADVRHVVVGGKTVVARRPRTRRSTWPRELRRGGAERDWHERARRSTTSGCSSPAIPSSATGRSGSSAMPRVVIEDDRVTAIERAGAAADERLDAGGRCVIPGFVDSHTHLVFAGDRADEFAARMAVGRTRPPASASRPRPRAPRASDELRALAAPAAARRSRRHHAHRDQVGLRARRRGRAALLRGRRRAHRRRDVPRRARGADRVRGPRRRLRRARVRRRCSTPARRYARWIDVFCEDGAFDADQSRAVLEAGRGAGPGAARARQPARLRPRRAARGRDGRGLGRPLHLPGRRRHRRARRQRHRRHLPARHRLLDPPAVSRRAPRDRRRRARSRSRPTATRARATRPRWRSASRSPCATCA